MLIIVNPLIINALQTISGKHSTKRLGTKLSALESPDQPGAFQSGRFQGLLATVSR
jgi:hypothetical protein